MEAQSSLNPPGEHEPGNDPERWIIDQRWDQFTAADHETWELLYRRQSARVRDDLISQFAEGMEAIALPCDQIPDFRILSEQLRQLTGWSVVAVPGLIPEADFFELLARRLFPAGNFIRGKDQLDYIEEPDVFHDVFGHVPLLANPDFAAVMERLGLLGIEAARTGALDAITRLYWYTVEFGLARGTKLQAYGAGIASSPAELDYALRSDVPRREVFDLRQVTQTSYRYDAMQPLYFVIPSLSGLLEILQGFDLRTIVEGGPTPCAPTASNEVSRVGPTE